MANYPLSSTIKTTEDARHKVSDGRQVDNTADGLWRVRKLYDDRRAFTVAHQPLSLAAYTTLDAFYEANKTGTFYYVDPIKGTTYTVAFAAGLEVKKLNGGVAYMVTAYLVQVA